MDELVCKIFGAVLDLSPMRKTTMPAPAPSPQNASSVIYSGGGDSTYGFSAFERLMVFIEIPLT